MLRCIVSLKRRISRVPVPGYLPFQLPNPDTLGTGEDSVISISAPGARGNGEDSVKTALGIHGTGRNSGVSAPGARETGQDARTQVISAPGARETREDARTQVISAPGARETGEELLMVVSALVGYSWDWRGLTTNSCGSVTVSTSRCSS